MYSLSDSFHSAPPPGFFTHLAVTALGRFRAETPYFCNRSDGWHTEHLALTTAGCCHVTVDGAGFTALPGSLLITPRALPYTLRTGDSPGFWEGCWIEYTGKSVYELWKLNGLEGRYLVNDNGILQETVQAIFDSYKNNGDRAAASASARMGLLFAQAGDLLKYGAGETAPGRVPVERACAYARRNFAQPIGLTEMAEAAGMSRYHFLRVFTGRTGYTPGRYLASLRIGRARELMLTTELNIAEIAYRSGFSSPAYFSSVFKKATGFSPRRFAGSVRGGGK